MFVRLALDGPVVGGEIVPVTVTTDRASLAGFSLELWVTERFHFSQVAWRSQDREHMLASILVPPDARELAFRIPHALTPAATGEAISWRYEMRLVGPGRSPLTTAVPVWPEPGGFEAEAFSGRLVSDPLEKNRLALTMVERNGSLVPVFVLMSGASLVLISLVVFASLHWLTLLMLVIFVAIPADAIVKKRRQGRWSHVRMETTQPHIAPGESFRVAVHSEGPASGLEISLAAFEMAYLPKPGARSASASSGGHGYAVKTTQSLLVATRTVVVPQLSGDEGAEGTIIEVPTLSDDPIGYAGENVSLHWIVTLKAPGIAVQKTVVDVAPLGS